LLILDLGSYSWVNPECKYQLNLDQISLQFNSTESNLEENHHLENVGDIIWLTSLNVLCCPYCGEQLPGLESADKTSYGYFQHNDFSRWH
jgi:hypothetical protein